jgi:RNA-directed DNA polymerase
VLDADIASCFDRIDQKALLEKINTSPHFARPIREWLKAGVVDNGIFMPTEAGTPQLKCFLKISTELSRF